MTFPKLDQFLVEVEGAEYPEDIYERDVFLYHQKAFEIRSVSLNGSPYKTSMALNQNLLSDYIQKGDIVRIEYDIIGVVGW